MNRMPDLVQLRPQLKQPTGDVRQLHGTSRLDTSWYLLRFSVHGLLLLLAAGTAVLGSRAAGLNTSGAEFVWLYPPLTLVILAARGTYRHSMQLEISKRLPNVLYSTTLATITMIAAAAVIGHDSESASLMLRTWAIGAGLLCAGVPVLTTAERRARRKGAVSMPTLVVGAGQIGTQIERRLAEQPELGLRVVGYVDADPVPWQRVPERQAPVLGPPDEFAEIAEKTGAEHVILTFTSSPDSVLVPLIRACEDRGLHVWLVPRMFESVNLRVFLDNIGPLPIFGLKWVDPKGWQFAIKHIFDRMFSAILVLALAPLLLAIAVAVRLSSPGPILYKQRRIGRDGQRFEMLKFRSMRVENDSDPADWVKPGVAPGGVEGLDRRTRVGRFIRSYSLDELPQLINVLRGEMSLIGPRPERPEYAEMFDERVRRYADRHRVKSGITGLAQVNGYRGKTSLPERVELDNYYIQNWSMMLDLRILIRTFAAILRPAE